MLIMQLKFYLLHIAQIQSVYRHCAFNYYMTNILGQPHDAASICPVYLHIMCCIHTVLSQNMAQTFISFQQLFTLATKQDRQLYKTSVY